MAIGIDHHRDFKFFYHRKKLHIGICDAKFEVRLGVDFNHHILLFYQLQVIRNQIHIPRCRFVKTGTIHPVLRNFIQMPHNVKSAFANHVGTYFEVSFCSHADVTVVNFVQSPLKISKFSVHTEETSLGQRIEIMHRTDFVFDIAHIVQVVFCIKNTFNIVNFQPEKKFNLPFIFLFQSVKLPAVVSKII